VLAPAALCARVAVGAVDLLHVPNVFAYALGVLVLERHADMGAGAVALHSSTGPNWLPFVVTPKPSHEAWPTNFSQAIVSGRRRKGLTNRQCAVRDDFRVERSG